MAIDTACNVLRGETNSGKSVAATIVEAAAVAVAGYNTAVALDMANLQWEITKQYLNISQSWRDYYNNTFKPYEDQELAEANALTPATPEYDVSVGRHRVAAHLTAGMGLRKLMRCTRPEHVGLREMYLHDAALQYGNALMSSTALGFDNERAWKDAMDDTRWKKREQVVNRGRDMIANNIMFSQLSNGIYGDLGKQARDGAGGALYYLGYRSNRIETSYPVTGYQVPYTDDFVGPPEPQTYYGSATIESNNPLIKY